MSHPRAAVLSALLALAVGAGCAGGWHLRGRAVRGTSGPGVPSSDRGDRNLPLTEARVTIECPEGSEGASRLSRVELRADMDGRFRGSGDGALPMDCFIGVEAPGYSGEAFRVAEVCRSERSGDGPGCVSATVQATLPPAL